MEKNARYFIGRQPILNRESELVGFELLFRAAADHESALFDNQGHAAASVITPAIKYSNYAAYVTQRCSKNFLTLLGLF